MWQSDSSRVTHESIDLSSANSVMQKALYKKTLSELEFVNTEVAHYSFKALHQHSIKVDEKNHKTRKDRRDPRGDVILPDDLVEQLKSITSSAKLRFDKELEIKDIKAGQVFLGCEVSELVTFLEKRISDAKIRSMSSKSSSASASAKTSPNKKRSRDQDSSSEDDDDTSSDESTSADETEDDEEDI